MANLQRGVGSLVRDIGDPCLNPSPVKVAYLLCFFIYPLPLFNMDCMMGIDADSNVNANDVLLSLVCDNGDHCHFIDFVLIDTGKE